MKFDIFFKKPRLVNSVLTDVITIDGVVNFFTNDKYIYFISLKEYKRFFLNDITLFIFTGV